MIGSACFTAVFALPAKRWLPLHTLQGAVQRGSIFNACRWSALISITLPGGCHCRPFCTTANSASAAHPWYTVKVHCPESKTETELFWRLSDNTPIVSFIASGFLIHVSARHGSYHFTDWFNFARHVENTALQLPEKYIYVRTDTGPSLAAPISGHTLAAT